MTSQAADHRAAVLETAARDLAARHAIAAEPPRPLPLRVHLAAMPAWLERAHNRLAEPAPAATKAAEWLLDNEYLVQRASRQIAEDLPPGFYARLPRLVDGVAAALPRVFELAHVLLRASRLQLSLPSAVEFVRAYQDAGQVLTIAETWAFPTMLRLSCLELLVTALARVLPGLTPPGAPTALAEEPAGLEDTECIARAIANLRVIDATPWKEFFVQTNRVEAVLNADPAGIYARMDFASRDRYRKAVEELAWQATRAEPEVAAVVLERARRADGNAPEERYLGHWLLGDGRAAMERALGCRRTARAVCRRWLFRHAGALYAAALTMATAGAVALPFAYLRLVDAGPLASALGVALAMLPASAVSISLVHRAITMLVAPRVLPKLDCEAAIPGEYATAVVVPALVASPAEAASLIARLENHYLANPDPALRFALLSDFADAAAATMPDDAAVLAALVDGARRLNDRHGSGGTGPFHVLHRPRRFRPAQGCWMGWERKRGKLEQFTQLLLGEGNAFTVHEGDAQALRGIRFVVTLDADTRLPPGSVARLVGTLAHPLNQAVFDETTGRVRSGYTVVQPRLEITPASANRSLFASLYAGDAAIDIYTRAVSDVYQDLFASGIYVGKGIFDVNAFRRSLAGRVPEDAVASHDLFEGIHGRVALASDIVLYEQFPATYPEFARRWHRWVRGDWQLLPWLRRNVPAGAGRRLPNRLAPIDRWKIIDNLRRSAMPPAVLALLAGGWLALPGAPWVWTALGVLAPGAYLFTDLVAGLPSGARRGAMRGLLWQLREQAGRWLLALVFLVHDAATALDAIARTVWRLAISRRLLLEWVPAAHAGQPFAGASRRAYWREMWAAPVVAGTLAAAVAPRPAALACAAPLLLLWFASPEIAALLGRPRRRRAEVLGRDDRAFARRLARRTWLFFETFAGPDDHWLPPDNVQEEPLRDVAHRTSPTNVAMLLLASMSARDLGYLGLSELSARVRETLDTLERLERVGGHMLNWYDTRSLDALEPRYVSTVDSGNLAVSLIALKEGCRQIAAEPVLRPACWDGLADALALLAGAIEPLPDGAEMRALRQCVTATAARIAAARAQPEGWRAALATLATENFPALDRLLTAAIAGRGAGHAAALHELHIWRERTRHQLRGMQQELDRLQPWRALLAAAPATGEDVRRAIARLLPVTLPLAATAARCDRARAYLAEVQAQLQDPPGRAWHAALSDAIDRGGAAAAALHAALRELGARAEAFAMGMDFRLLFDREVRRFRIGYNVSADRLDANHYDLLATEARLASFFAIAKRDVPVEHWFFLGRPVARAGGTLALISWGGSMFEYLMPPLLLRREPGTLLATSELTAIAVQRRHAEQRGIPWGMSESGFAAVNPSGHYRYQTFGVPGIALRRDVARDLVVAPYAAALALPIAPAAALANLRALDGLGLVGLYGFFEAADFTAGRVPAGRRFAVVRSHMAHHQGMILAAIGNALCDQALVRRFHADPRVRAVELLLDERLPRDLVPAPLRPEPPPRPARPRPAVPAPGPWVPAGPPTVPRLHALGNGRLADWISDGGGGGLRWRDCALTRWIPDATRDADGLWIYVRDVESDAVWSVTRQPAQTAADEAGVVFHPHLAEFHRRAHGIAIGMEVGVAAADDVEIRRLTIVNESGRPRVLTLTSYGEVVLAPPRDDERHPAFSKLSVYSQHLPALDALLFSRRPRDPRQAPPLLLHRFIGDDPAWRCRGFEADREGFLGRLGDPRRPPGVVRGLTGTAGWTLDPVMALQVQLTLEPRERRELAFLTMTAGSRASVLELADRYATLASLEWALTDAAAAVTREVQELGLQPERLPELQVLASLLLYAPAALRAAPATLRANQLGQPKLWGLALSGDLPILLVWSGDAEDPTLLRTLLRGHELWRRRGLRIDLVVLHRGASSYTEPLRQRLLDLLQELGPANPLGQGGGIHLLFADQMPGDERRLLECAARVVLDDGRGSLAEQLAAVAAPPAEVPQFQTSGAGPATGAEPPLARPADLRFANGFGGFTADGREYAIHLEPGEHTPAPWANVLANEAFGSLVTEAGTAFTWAVNSGENRLTPWSNDPIADTPGEALYLRDEETAEFWTPTPQPVHGGTAYQIRHGAGYTEWAHDSHRLEQRLLAFVPSADPVKVVRLRLRNRAPHPRRITATYYAEWVLGALRSAVRPFVVVDYDAASHALLARNPWNPEFADRVAFVAADLPAHGVTADRGEFLGREGDLRRPAALRRWGLSGRVEPGEDACAALQVHVDIAAEATAEVVFLLGQGQDRAHAEALIRRWRLPEQVAHAFEELAGWWDRRLGAVQVRTPDAAFDLLVNRWLPYQAIASRILARAGFYQAGGAIGFRDQLQDMLALLWSEPGRVRAHLLACAAHQFEAGDVLHWWHPPADRGVRTRCSDDLLWLPYVTSRYVAATDDAAVLDEQISFLQAPPLTAREDDRYAQFEAAPDRHSLYEHCARAIEHADTQGPHRLPLIGTGDWNDGLDRVGRRGRGESVWLAWFAIAALRGGAALADRRGDDERAARWRARAEQLAQAAEAAGWDGEWYLRAFDDDGRPWGSHTGDECRIDSVAQSWAVLCGAADPARARGAIAAAARALVREEEGIVRLLWPPFDRTPRDPGYIKAYPPGIRENGGQYTHAAAWLTWAFAALGDGDRAADLFDLLNPIRRTADRAGAERYRVEPYVLAADVGAVAPHVGRGGWTWYTGSAAWLWRVAVEAILGLRLDGGRLVVAPCLPEGWHQVEAQVGGAAGSLAVSVQNPDGAGGGVVELSVDGSPWAEPSVPFPADGSVRRVIARLGTPAAARRARGGAPASGSAD